MAVGSCRNFHYINLIKKMGLQLNEISQNLKEPKKTQVIQKAVRHENRLRFHTETFLEPSEISQPLTVFLDWVKTLIPKDKYNIFVSLFKFPTPIIELSERIFSELERVFDGRNPAINFQFQDSKLRDDWEYYRQEKLHEPNIWREKGFQALKTSINSFVVVDLPSEQTSELPEPYFYFLPVDRVIDFGTKGGKVDWIIFRQDGNKVACFDDEFFRLVSVNDKKEITVISEQAHELGYCPVSFFWGDQLNQKTPDIKKSPLSPQLANIDWLLFFQISKRHLDLYAPYPIYSAYEAECDFRNNENLDYCDGGFLRNNDGNYKLLRDGTVERCPVCSEKRVAGVGSFIEVPLPRKDGNGGYSPDLRDPVSITTIDKESLDFNVKESERLRDNIFSGVVGIGGDIQKKTAINEMQVSANFEDKSSVLNNLKQNFERIIKFTDETICRLRYGVDYLSSSVSLGTEFYIYSVDDLYSQYKQAKENGASESQLDSISEQIISTENRNNPVQLQRMLILKQLEPYRHYTRAELITLNDKRLIDPDLMRIKINFNSFVDRFERENTNIIEFGSLLSFDKKIQIINQKFLEYGREQKAGEQPGGDPGAN